MSDVSQAGEGDGGGGQGPVIDPGTPDRLPGPENPTRPTGFQWQPAISPAYRRRAFCKIFIGNDDVTNILEPFLISVKVTLKRENTHEAAIELDDRDAKLSIPQTGESVRIDLGWAGSGPRLPTLARHVSNILKLLSLPSPRPGELPWATDGMKVVFEGIVEKVESGFNRKGGGRRLWIDATSSNYLNLEKEPQLASEGDGTKDVSMMDFITKRAAAAGLKFVGVGMQDIKRKFWVQENESFMHMAHRLAAETGLAFQIVNGTAYMMPNELGAGGEQMPTVEAIWGINLMQWRIRPFAGRAQWKAGAARHFDIWKGLWQKVEKGVGGNLPFGFAQATAGLPNSAPNAQVGDQWNSGTASTSELNRGTGWCIINGEPSAQARGAVVMIGARPGVDGRYLIDEAEHNYTRSGGYTTRLNLIQPFPDYEAYKKMGWKVPEPDAPVDLELPAEQQEAPIGEGVIDA